MKTMPRFLLIAVLVAVVPLAAQAQQLFDFNGQAAVPASVGGTLEMVAVVLDPSPLDTPIPLDFSNYEFTVVIAGATLDVDGSTQVYSGGTLTIYQDAGTAADYAAPATFSDGVAVLVGDLEFLNRTMFTSTIGTVNGMLDWTGGARLDDIAPEDQLDWPVLSGISRHTGNVEPGFDENWDGKVEPTTPIVSNEVMSWGQIKAMF